MVLVFSFVSFSGTIEVSVLAEFLQVLLLVVVLLVDVLLVF